MNKKIYFILLALMAWSFGLSAQSIAIDNETADPGATGVGFDVTLSSLPADMGAISLFITFDDNVLDFAGYNPQNIDDGGALFVVNDMGSQVGIQWVSGSPTGSDINGVLLELLFDYAVTGGESDIGYGAGTEFTRIDLSNVDVDRINGSIAPNAGVPTLTIGDSIKPGGGPYTMYIDAEGFGAKVIGSMNLRIEFDPDEVTLDNGAAYDAITPVGGGWPATYGYSTNGVVTFAFADLTGVTFPDGHLLQINILSYSGVNPSPFKFVSVQMTDNEIAETPTMTKVTASFNSGSINPAGSANQLTLSDESFSAGTNPASFSLTADFVDPASVGSMALVINYDPAKLSNPTVNDGIITGWTSNVVTPGTLNMQWAGGPLASNGVVATIDFNYISGDCDLAFDGGSEVSDMNLDVVPTQYNDGSVSLIAGGPEARIPTISGTPGQPIAFPISVKNFLDPVGAISLYIGYDPAVLQYNGVTDGTLTGYYANLMGPGLIGIAWYKQGGSVIDPSYPAEDILATLNFTYIGGECDVTFNMGCEFAEPDLDVIPVSFYNGGVALQTAFSIKAFLDGAYDSTTMDMYTTLNPDIPLAHPYGGAPWNYTGTESVAAMPANVVDWILVELREGPDPNSAVAVATRAALLLDDGTIVDVDGASEVAVDYIFTDNIYAVVYHRNHLGVMSSLALTQNVGDSYYSYDFTDAASKAIGGINGVKNLGPVASPRFGLFSGDADANANVQTQDKNNWWLPQVGSAGYKEADFDLNGQVQSQDKNNKWLKNVGKSSQIP